MKRNFTVFLSFILSLLASLYRSAVDLNMHTHVCVCISACTRGRARVVSAHLHFSFLGPRLLFNTLSIIISFFLPLPVRVCTSWVSAEILPSDVRRVLFSFNIACLFSFAVSACVRMSRGCIFSALTHFFSYLVVSLCVCLCMALFSQTTLTHCVHVYMYLCLYAHSFRFYWVNLDFERIPFGFNTLVRLFFFAVFVLCSGTTETKKVQNDAHQQNSLPTATARPV